jgi:hypothetical protein
MSTITMRISLNEQGAGPEELERAALSVRDDLLCHGGILDVRPATQEVAPPGTRGLSAADVGSLFVLCGSAVDMVEPVLNVATAWMRRQPQVPERSIRLELDGQQIELTGHDTETQRKLVDLFVERVSTSTPALDA